MNTTAPYKYQFASEFYIKIFAILFMTLDHIGLLIMMFYPGELGLDTLYSVGYVLRCVGRIAFPLFILMLIEGIRHSKNIKLYISRIAILTFIIMLAQIVIYYAYNSAIRDTSSPFVDLLLSAVFLYLLQRKDKFSYLSIIILAYVLLTTVVQIYEFNSYAQGSFISVDWLPFYIRPGYSILGLGLSTLFYYSYNISNKLIKRNPNLDNIDFDLLTQTKFYRSTVNMVMITCLVFVNILVFFTRYIYINGAPILNIYNSSIQTWSILALLFILIYNGDRGYNKKWFQYGSYAYFPLHIIILFVIFYVISLM